MQEYVQTLGRLLSMEKDHGYVDLPPDPGSKHTTILACGEIAGKATAQGVKIFFSLVWGSAVERRIDKCGKRLILRLGSLLTNREELHHA